MKYLQFCKTIYQNCAKNYLFVCKMKLSSRLGDLSVVFALQSCAGLSKLCDCSFYFKTPKHPWPLTYTAFPVIQITRNHPQIFSKHLLVYGTMPIESHCCTVFWRQRSIRRNWDLEYGNLQCFSVAGTFCESRWIHSV